MCFQRSFSQHLARRTVMADQSWMISHGRPSHAWQRIAPGPFHHPQRVEVYDRCGQRKFTLNVCQHPKVLQQTWNGLHCTGLCGMTAEKYTPSPRVLVVRREYHPVQKVRSDDLEYETSPMYISVFRGDDAMNLPKKHILQREDWCSNDQPVDRLLDGWCW